MRKQKKKSAAAAPREELVTRGHMTAVLERMEENQRAIIDAVYAVEERITKKFEARFQAIESRLDALEASVRVLADLVRKNSEDIRKNSEDIVQLRKETHRLAAILGADSDENAIQALERRVSALEARTAT